MFQSYQFRFEEVCPDVETLMGFLQIPDIDSYSLVQDTVEHTFSLLTDSQEIVGGYTLLDCEEIHVKEGEVVCTMGAISTGKRISGYLKGASQMALFLCTAGRFFTDLSHSYQRKGDFLEAYVVEAIGSATVENAMDNVQLFLDKEMEQQGLKISNRYSPGYCDWALSGQQPLFSYIGENPTGISLSESCLMQPIKSVSGIIGIGKEMKKQPYGCGICSSTTCVYRGIKNKTQQNV